MYIPTDSVTGTQYNRHSALKMMYFLEQMKSVTLFLSSDPAAQPQPSIPAGLVRHLKPTLHQTFQITSHKAGPATLLTDTMGLVNHDGLSLKGGIIPSSKEDGV